MREHHYYTSLKNTDNHQYNTRSSRKNVFIPAGRLKLSDKAPSRAGKRFFNSLPEDIKNISDFNIFKRKLRKHLLEMGLYKIEDFNRNKQNRPTVGPCLPSPYYY